MDRRGNMAIVVLIVVVVIVIAGAIVSLVSNKTPTNNKLSSDVCVYDNQKYITCGTAFVLVLEGVEYPLVANEKFYFPQGENKLIGLVDDSKPEGERASLLYLEEGEHVINEETSRKAVGSSTAN